MRYINMEKGITAIIDDEDFQKVAEYRWHLKKEANGKIYAYGRKKLGNKNNACFLHRLISNPSMNEVVEFINGNTLDCRAINLKVISRSLHHRRNRKAKSLNGKPCSSIFKGVYFDKSSNKWKANIGINGKTKYLGSYHSEVEAAMAYNKACIQVAGEYAYSNNPSNSENGLCNMTEVLKDIEAGTIHLSIGKRLKHEILYYIEDFLRNSDGSNPDKAATYSSVVNKLNSTKEIFNQEEIMCIFNEFPVFDNTHMINNPELENDVKEFIASNPFDDVFNVIQSIKYTS